jgi:hypothetical protein
LLGSRGVLLCTCVSSNMHITAPYLADPKVIAVRQGLGILGC